MARRHGPQIKDDAQHETLRARGMSKERAARTANTGRTQAGRRGGSSPRHEDMTREQVYARARKVGVSGRSRMTKQELIRALRHP